MMQTVNISLPTSILDRTKAYMENLGYASISEVVCHALRKMLGIEELTENGFTPQAERNLMEIMKEPPVLTVSSDEDINIIMDKIMQKSAELDGDKN